MRIGYIFDEGFTVPAAVSIYSLLYNNRHLKDLSLFVLDDGIKEDSKTKLLSMVKKFNRKIEFIDVKPVKEKLEKITSFNWNGSYSTYIRLMLNTLMPDAEDTILMIDGDTVIVREIDWRKIENLFMTPLFFRISFAI